MEKTDAGTTVGVDDPYDHVDRCDHLTDDGRCRFAIEHADRDPEFARELAAEEYRCPVIAAEGDEGSPATAGRSASGSEFDWRSCEQFRCRNHDRACRRCGLDEVRVANSPDRPLLEEHHLSYAAGSADGSGDPGHEITVYLCRWCHATVHKSWGRIDDDVNPDPAAIAEREARLSREQEELSFTSAKDRYDRG